MSPTEVRKALEPRFAFTRTETGTAGTMLVHHGSVAGLPTDTVETMFDAHGLQAVHAEFPKGDQVPASKRYEQLIAVVTEGHGAPSKGGQIPSHRANEYDLLDRGLQKEEWSAAATWELDGALCVVEVERGHASDSGEVPLRPVVTFASPEFAKRLDAMFVSGRGDL